LKKTIVADFTPREEIDPIVMKIKNPKDRALIELLYLSAGRVTEVLQLKKSHFMWDWMDTHHAILRMPNEKSKKFTFKTVPLPKDDAYMNDVFNYVYALDSKNSYLFPMKKTVYGYELEPKNRKEIRPMSRQNAWNIVKRYFPRDRVWPHWFRHQRLSHLAHMGLSDRELVIMAGHTDSRQLAVYVRMNPMDIAKKITGATV